MKDTRILFMGTPEFATFQLKRILEEGYNVVGVVTVPDKPKGRGLQLAQSDVKKFVLEYNLQHPEKDDIPILQPAKLKDESFLKELQSLNADLFIVVAFRMLPEVVWQMPRLGTFNLHASLLPKYRGAAPINWAIINRENESGVTTFFLDKQIDTGGIILQERCAIEARETIETLYDKLMNIGSGVVIKTIEKILSGDKKTTQQSEIMAELGIGEDDKSLKAPKIDRDTCTINWNNSAIDIDAQVRGLAYPGCTSSLVKIANTTSNNSQDRIDIKIYKTELCNDVSNGSSGEIKESGNRLYVRCADNWIEIKELQLAGKKRMNAEDFLRGFREIKNFKFNS